MRQETRIMENNENKIAYRKLIAWQKADELAFQIYQVTKDFPQEEKFGLISQMRRAALSVAANIAEGYTRRSKKDKVHFYNIAQGSLTEIEYYLDFSRRLGYIHDDKYQELIKLRSEIGRLLFGLSRNTNAKWMAALFLVLGLLFLAPVTHAANLYFSPSSGTHAVGSSFSVSVYVSSADQAMNAASGVVSFPQDKLEVVSLSKAGSIFSLWVQEPSFFNPPSGEQGTINFEGIVLNPGFTGSSGKIITLNFRVKAEGIAPVNFSSGSVLANDGKGTNILINLGDANFSFVVASQSAPETTIPIKTAGTPAALQIKSSTHPDSDKWYAINNAEFSWPISPDITAIRLLYGRIPQAIPTINYSPAISSKELFNLEDGIWYFHVRLKNSAGWGEISHYKFQIDAENPSRFDITEISREDLAEPKARFIFNAKDEISGIDYYEIQIDGKSVGIWKDDETHRYETPILNPGKHTLIAKAIDKAGNSLASSAEFMIEKLNPPVITEYPKELQGGIPLVIRGSTYPISRVTIWLQKEKDEPKSFAIQSNQEGLFSFISDEKLKDGVYELWAEVTDVRGAKSLPSKKITITITPPVLFRIGNWAVGILTIMIPLIALIILLILIFWYSWRKFSQMRKRIKEEVHEAESALHKAFDLLKEDIEEQIKMLEKTRNKRQLTEEEEKIINHFKKDLDDAEKFVKKEIKDIEREIK